jgi:hypothetical protein
LDGGEPEHPHCVRFGILLDNVFQVQLIKNLIQYLKNVVKEDPETNAVLVLRFTSIGRK